MGCVRYLRISRTWNYWISVWRDAACYRKAAARPRCVRPLGVLSRVAFRLITNHRLTPRPPFTRAVRTIAQWCRFHRHDLVSEQHVVLCQKLRGHCAYYRITGNSFAISRFRYEVLRLWRKWLLRRRRAWRGTFDWFGRLLNRYPLPSALAVHSVCRGVANG